MRQVHRAGEKLFVDYSGKRPSIVDAKTGEVIELELFVAVLGASNYTYAEATAQDPAHVRGARAPLRDDGAAGATGASKGQGEGGARGAGRAALDPRATSSASIGPSSARCRKSASSSESGRRQDRISITTWPSTCHYYSVPHTLREETFDVRMTTTTVELLLHNVRVDSYPRS